MTVIDNCSNAKTRTLGELWLLQANLQRQLFVAYRPVMTKAANCPNAHDSKSCLMGYFCPPGESE